MDTSQSEAGWDDEPRLAEILELEGWPVLGMPLLDTSDLHMDDNKGGKSIIGPI